MLLDEILKRSELQNHQTPAIHVHPPPDGEKIQLTLLEEKIKEVLTMLRSLNSMVNRSFNYFIDYLFYIILLSVESTLPSKNMNLPDSIRMY